MPPIDSPTKWNASTFSAARTASMSAKKFGSDQHAAALRLGYVEPLVVRAAIGDIGGGEALAGPNPIERFAESAEYPHRAQSGVGDGEIIFVIHCKAVGPAEASG